MLPRRSTVTRRRFLAAMAVGSTAALAVRQPLRAAAQAEASSWILARNRGTIAGFADRASVAEGDQLALYVTTHAPSFSVEVYRLGWYDDGASQALLVDVLRDIDGVSQAAPRVDAQTGLVSAAHWSPSASFRVPAWRSGLYLIKLIAADNDQNYIPLVVRDDVASHDLLFQHASATDQAYNGWGGKSLYEFNSQGPPTIGRSRAAVKVAFDRPFDGDGAGRGIPRWELSMVRWLEANGFDATYVSDLDVHKDASFDSRARAVLQVGHNEYWSAEMRDHLEAARDRGKGLGFFTGDTGAWACGFEDSPLGQNRIQVCYRDPSLDPAAAGEPSRASSLWARAPLARPTHQLFGMGSLGGLQRSADWVVAGASSVPQLFVGTGLHTGDVVRNLVGYECDGLWASGAGTDVPAGVEVLGRAQVALAEPGQGRDDPGVRYQFGRAQLPSLGWFASMFETSRPWVLYVSLTGAPFNAQLQYVPGTGTPRRYSGDGAEYAVLPVGAAFTQPGWHTLERDLEADYTTGFGSPAGSAVRIDSLFWRGSLSIGATSISSPGGKLTSMLLDQVETEQPPGWRREGGIGDVGVQPLGPSGEPVLVLRASRPNDEADSVFMRSPTGAPIIAVGSIQWSWALDSFGQHVDAEGRRTEVDPRIQALTRNMLQVLLGRDTGELSS